MMMANLLFFILLACIIWCRNKGLIDWYESLLGNRGRFTKSMVVIVGIEQTNKQTTRQIG